jgi:hypothetical protein
MGRSGMSGMTMRQWSGALALAAALAWPPAHAADAPRHEVRDPYYGVGLFDFFQARYFSALTDLMVAQHFERLPHHVDEAELLRGGLLLSYGMHRQAGEIFERLIGDKSAPAVRDRAWFYLAKIRYQRGLLADAEAAITRVGMDLPAEMEDERRLLHANLLMARGDFTGAVAVLKKMKSDSAAIRYARYNLGVALVKAGDAARGEALLDEVGKSEAKTEEYRSLRDKANVALGFSALQANQPERAGPYLERVRLDGMLADKALLGFGWAQAAQQQPKQALVPWMELARRDNIDAAVLEAKLAVPYALGELGAYSQSLGRYEDAMATFDRENANIDESIAMIRSGKLLDELVAANPGAEMGWFWHVDSLPELPHLAQLTDLLAENEFQEAFKNYRDLLFMERNLSNWSTTLDTLRDMLDNRRKAFAQRLPAVQAGQRSMSIAGLMQRRAEVAGGIEAAAAAGDGHAFADARERDLLARVDRVRAVLTRLPESGDSTAASERLRRVAGAMEWQLAQENPERLWAARKGLADIDAGLTEAHRRDADLAQAQLAEPARFEHFARRIDELERRILALTPRVTKLAEEQRSFVQEMAVAALQTDKERIAAYITQARFAIAQIYDRANRAQEAGHAAAR